MKIKKLLAILSCFVLVLVAGITLAACNESAPKLTKIELDETHVIKNFKVGETFTTAGLAVKAVYDNNTSSTVTDYTAVAKLDNNTTTVQSGATFAVVGTYTVTITYQEKTATYSSGVTVEVVATQQSAIANSEADLNRLMNNPAYDSITLGSDITLTGGTLNITKDLTINLNGHSIKEELEWNAGTEDESAKLLSTIHVLDGKTLTLTGNGSIISDDLFGIDVGTSEAAAHLVIDGNILVKGNMCAVRVQKGLAEIKNGTYEVSGHSESWGSKYLLNCINDVPEAQIVVTGGTFIGFNPAEATSDDASSYLAEGYTTYSLDDEIYYVTETRLHVSTEAELRAAIANAAESDYEVPVVLDQDITVTKEALNITGSITIDLNGHTIDEDLEMKAGSLVAVFQVKDEKTLTLTGKGSILADNLYAINVGTTSTKGYLIIDGDILVQGGTTAVQVQKGQAAICGGTYKAYNSHSEEDSRFLLNCINDAPDANIMVIGGTFYNFDPSKAKNDDNGADQTTNYIPFEFITVDKTVDGSDNVYTINNPSKDFQKYVVDENSLREAIENAEDGAFIPVIGNPAESEQPITLTNVIDVNKNITLYVCTGVEIKTERASKLFTVSNGATLTIDGNGTFTGSGKIVRVGYVTEDEGVTPSQTGHLVIKGGTFTAADEVVLVSRGTLEVLGGEYTSSLEGGKFTLNILDESLSDESTSITVKGGTFHNNFNPQACYADTAAAADTNYVTENDCVCFEVSAGVWQVSKTQHVSNYQQLLAAIENGGSIVLDDNVELEDTVVVEKAILLNLNSHTITKSTSGYAFRIHTNTTAMTILGGTIDTEGNIFAVGSVSANTTYGEQKGNLVIKGGTFTTKSASVVTVLNGLCRIEGGDYTAAAWNDVYYNTINIYDSSVAGSKLVVAGGTFHNFDPAATNCDAKLEDNHISIKAEDSETWTVSEGGTSVSTYNDLKTAIENGGKVALAGDIVLENYVTVSKETTLYMNGHKLSVTGHNMFYIITGEETFTVEGNGNFESTQNTADDCPTFFVGAQGSTAGHLVIKNGTFKNTNGPEIVYVMNGSAEILGGDFTAVKDTENNKFYTLNIYDDSKTGEAGTITVKGGTFHGFNPANTTNDPGEPHTYVADGYTCSPATDAEGNNDNTVFTVTKNAEED